MNENYHVFGNAATATIPIVAAVAQQRVSIQRLVVTIASPAVTLIIQDSTGAALSQTFQLAVNAALVFDIAPNNGEPWWTTLAGRGVQLAQSGTSNIGFDCWYLQHVG
jgi:hypothetical protein